MFNYQDYKVFLACGSTDMRKSINSLCEIVQHHFELDPTEKIIFGFCNKQHNRVKLLVWEDNGFWIHFKRLEKGGITWPEALKTESKKVLDEFYTWINGIAPKTLPQSLLGKAVTYVQNQKEYLSNFLKDGRIQLSNNLAEQSIKMFVIGRKNWLFSNTLNGASLSSIIYSMLCKQYTSIMLLQYFKPLIYGLTIWVVKNFSWLTKCKM